MVAYCYREFQLNLLLRSVQMKKALFLCALGTGLLGSQVAKADQVQGSATFQDYTSNNLLAVVASGTGNFTENNVTVNGSTVTDHGFLEIYSYIATDQTTTLTDQIGVNFTITEPGTGSGSLGGSATEQQTQIFGLLDYDTGTVTWNDPLSITLSNGDVLNISLQDVTLQNSSLLNPCAGYDDCASANATFSLTTAPAATPEPGSLALLGTSILGGAGILRRRLRA
jgi:hypothetical protein